MTTPIVVPNWNGAGRLAKLFASLRNLEGAGELILVDNGSTDASVAMAQAEGARVIALDQNFGFAAGVNRGIREVTGAWVAIVNNDVELESGWLKVLAGACEDASVWFATGKLLDSTHRNTIDGTYDLVCRGGTAWRCGAGRPDGPAFNARARIQIAPFTAVLVRRELFEQVGYLDEQFESYLEDVDFGLRCAARGLTGVYVPEAVGYHQGSATLGRWHAETVRRISRNQVLLVKKHGRWSWAVLIAQGLWGLLALRHGAGWPWLLGKLQGRRIALAAHSDVFRTLSQMEQQIQTIQQQTGFDLYWKLYFALT